MANCLLVVTLAPVVSVVGYELIGHRHMAAARRSRSVGRALALGGVQGVEPLQQHAIVALPSSAVVPSVG